MLVDEGGVKPQRGVKPLESVDIEYSSSLRLAKDPSLQILCTNYLVYIGKALLFLAFFPPQLRLLNVFAFLPYRYTENHFRQNRFWVKVTNNVEASRIL